MSGIPIIINHDCLSGMRSMAARSVDIIITDPPYEENVHRNQVRIRKNSDGSISNLTEAFELPFSPMNQEFRVQCALEFVRISKGWILVFCQHEAVGDWKRAIEYAHGIYKRNALWIKPNAQPQMSGDRPGNGAESIVCAHSTPGRSSWNGGGKLGLYYAGHDSVRYHPTQKPVELMDQLVTDFSNPGDLVFDPFAGSGSTGVSALKLGRKFFGIELNEEYYNLALYRLTGNGSNPLTPNQPSLFDALNGGNLGG